MDSFDGEGHTIEPLTQSLTWYVEQLSEIVTNRIFVDEETEAIEVR